MNTKSWLLLFVSLLITLLAAACSGSPSDQGLTELGVVYKSPT